MRTSTRQSPGTLRHKCAPRRRRPAGSYCRILGRCDRNGAREQTTRSEFRYDDDIPHAERILTEIVESHDKVLKDPEPNIKLHTLGDSSVNFVVRPWTETDDYWDVYWDIMREVKLRFDHEGISIPFPQRDVHLYNEGSA